MANWSKQFKQIDTINSGQEYTLNDYVTLDMVNAPLNNTQYLYDVLYTTNTGLIAKVNQNTTDIANTTNSLNQLKDRTVGTTRSTLQNNGSNISMYVYNNRGNAPEGDFFVNPDYVEIRFYEGPDSDNLASFKFLPNGSMQVSQDGSNYVTFSYDRFKPKYVHNVTYINRQLKHQISIEVISNSSTRVTDLNSLKNLINSKAVSELYSRFKASGSYVLGGTDMYVVSCIFIQSGDVMVRGQSTADFSIMEYEFSRLLSSDSFYDDFTDSMYEL